MQSNEQVWTRSWRRKKHCRVNIKNLLENFPKFWPFWQLTYKRTSRRNTFLREAESKKKKGKKKIITVKLNVYCFLLFSPWFCRLFLKSELPITDQLLMRSTSIFDFKLENMTSPGNFSHTVCYYISRFSPIILKCHEWHENMCRSGSIVLITGCDNLLRVRLYEISAFTFQNVNSIDSDHTQTFVAHKQS